MIFINQDRVIVRRVGEPVTLELKFVLVDIHPHDIEAMAETMKQIEIILAGTFEIKPIEYKDMKAYVDL